MDALVAGAVVAVVAVTGTPTEASGVRWTLATGGHIDSIPVANRDTVYTTSWDQVRGCGACGVGRDGKLRCGAMYKRSVERGRAAPPPA